MLPLKKMARLRSRVEKINPSFDLGISNAFGSDFAQDEVSVDDT